MVHADLISASSPEGCGGCGGGGGCTSSLPHRDGMEDSEDAGEDDEAGGGGEDDEAGGGGEDEAGGGGSTVVQSAGVNSWRAHVFISSAAVSAAAHWHAS